MHAHHRTIPTAPAPRWTGWRGALLLVAVVTLARIVFLAWFSPYELAGDEAHYWEWSRHLALSYYTKGPGIAWLIALSTSLLGDSEFSVRLPAVLCSAASMLVAARFACDVARGDPRAAFFGVLAWLCVPVYHATALLMTIDGPYMLCWITGAWCAWHVFDRCRHDRSCAAHLALLGAVLGVGFLFKYTILLLVPGLVLAGFLGRRSCRVTPARVGASVLGAVVFVVVISPVLAWNASNGWPTVAHLLGHLGAPGGDAGMNSGQAWDPAWPVLFAGSQLVLVGPMLVLMLGAAARRARVPGPEAQRLLVLCAAPVLLFYALLSLFIESEGNWPAAGYTTLLVLVAARAPRALAYRTLLVRRWRAIAPPRPRKGLLRRTPETPSQLLWHWSVAWGAGAALLLVSLAPLERVPALSGVIPLHRVSGHRARAALVQEQARLLAQETGREPVVIASRYDHASLLAFYLPGHPVVYSAASLLGDRHSPYDYFEDTNLLDPELLRSAPPAIFVAASTRTWSEHLLLDNLRRVDKSVPIHAADAYRGPLKKVTENDAPTDQ